MKYFLIFVTFAFYSCNQTPLNSDLSSHKKSPIKSKTEWIYTVVNPTHGNKNKTETYDKNGNLQKSEVFSPEVTGEISNKTIYKYEGDKIIEEDFSDYENKREIKYYFEYNIEGKQTRKKYLNYDKNNVWDSLVNRFDINKNLIQSVYYEAGDSTGSIEFKYNEKNELIHTLINDGFMSIEYFYTYKDSIRKESTWSLLPLVTPSDFLISRAGTMQKEIFC